MSHCGLRHALWHMVWVICGDLGNVCGETSKGGLLFMITWKTIVCLYWQGDLQSFFRNRFSQPLSNGENFFSDCKLENTNMGGEVQKVKASFQWAICLQPFSRLFIIDYISVSPSRDTVQKKKNTVDKELLKTYAGSLQLYLGSFLSPGLQWMQRFSCWKWTVKAW